VFARLNAIDWKVPFVLGRMAPLYNESLLGAGAVLPAVSLQTNEGRVLFQESWSPEVVGKLSAALDTAFGGAGSPTTRTARSATEPRR
jgi:hypothetical protein